MFITISIIVQLNLNHTVRLFLSIAVHVHSISVLRWLLYMLLYDMCKPDGSFG